jgi:hypothetical protein
MCFDPALLMFVASIVGLYFCIDATVDSISALTDQMPLSATFVGTTPLLFFEL